MQPETRRPEVRLVLTTESDVETAKRLARKLLGREIVACVTMAAVHSMYRWGDEIESTDEVQLLLKTDAAHLESLRGAISELHSYDVAEFLVLEADAGGEYESWLGAVLTTERNDTL